MIQFVGPDVDRVFASRPLLELPSGQAVGVVDLSGRDWFEYLDRPGSRGRTLTVDKEGGYWAAWGTARPRGSEPILATVQVPSEFLPVQLTDAWATFDAGRNRQELKSGWLHPDGVLYRCGYWEHDRMLSHYFNLTQEQAAARGFARVHAPREGELPFAYRLDHAELTEAQAKTMLELMESVQKGTEDAEFFRERYNL